MRKMILVSLVLAIVIGCGYAQRRLRTHGSNESDEQVSRRILERSAGSMSEMAGLMPYARYWAISKSDEMAALRQCESVAKGKGLQTNEVGTFYGFIVRVGFGYEVHGRYICIRETDPTRPLCPEGWEYTANTFGSSDGTWNNLGSCSKPIPCEAKLREELKTGFCGASSYGPIELRTTASDYQAWLAKQKVKQ